MCVCVCVVLLYSHQLGGQRSPLSTTGRGGFPSTHLNYNQSPRGHPGGQKEKDSKPEESEVMVGIPRIVGRDGPEYQPKKCGNRPLKGLADWCSCVCSSEKGSRRFVGCVKPGKRSTPEEFQGAETTRGAPNTVIRDHFVNPESHSRCLETKNGCL